MNKYELAENLTKLANELFKKFTHIVNIEEGFIEKPEDVLLDKGAYFEFNEMNCSALISQFIRFKVIPEVENEIIDKNEKYTYKIYIKYIPRDANQRSDKEALTFRILV